MTEMILPLSHGNRHFSRGRPREFISSHLQPVLGTVLGTAAGTVLGTMLLQYQAQCWDFHMYLGGAVPGTVLGTMGAMLELC